MKNYSILVVDDDPAIRETVTEILEWQGYPVATASDGAEALRLIETIQGLDRTGHLLLLLDMRMPILDGWGVARALKERGLEIPIIVMTAARDARIWAEQVDAAAYLAKPFELDDLLLTIRHISDPPGR